MKLAPATYSLVSNRRGGWNSWGVGKISKINSRGVGIIGGLEKISEINSRGGVGTLKIQCNDITDFARKS